MTDERTRTPLKRVDMWMVWTLFLCAGLLLLGGLSLLVPMIQAEMHDAKMKREKEQIQIIYHQSADTGSR